MAFETELTKITDYYQQQLKCCNLVDITEKEPYKASKTIELDQLVLDFSRHFIDNTMIGNLTNLYRNLNVQEKIHDMFSSKAINWTENRPALHIALRAFSSPSAHSQLIPQEIKNSVTSVLSSISDFSKSIRSGELQPSGHKVKEIILVGIGGSYLGTQFLYESLKATRNLSKDIQTRNNEDFLKLHFLANIDPYTVKKLINYDITCSKDELLVIAVSKTFTTRETLFNLKRLKEVLSLKNSQITVITSNPDPLTSFNKICYPENSTNLDISPFLKTFEMWDWVGGRFSVTSAVGVLPLSLSYGFNVIEKVLKGACKMDEHFYTERNKPFANVPACLGILDVYCRNVLKLSNKTILPYSEALSYLPAHIQQLEMESNGKRFSLLNDKIGNLVNYKTGMFVFGEAGTKGQHSFYQSLHQGEKSLNDFIGFRSGLTDCVDENYDELFSNFIAQPNSLAVGKQDNDLNKSFEGNRPSNVITFKSLNPENLGMLLALYEHRTAVQGFLWEINSFDQMGVQLGKEMGLSVRKEIEECRKKHELGEEEGKSDNDLINLYVQGK